MNIFESFNKTIVGGNSANVSIFHQYNRGSCNFLETDDAIYLDSIPCDKYTLSPITFYKDKPLNTVSTSMLGTAPITNTRFFNRAIGDGNKQQYRMPYGPKQTLTKNNVRLDNQDEVMITPTSVATANTNRGNSALYYTKATNKITKAFMADLGNYKPFIVTLDDSRYLAPTNAYQAITDGGCFGQMECQFTLFNKDTNAITNIPITTYGNIHNVIGKTLSGDILFLYTAFTGGYAYPNTTGSAVSGSIFSVKKFNKATSAISDVVSTNIGSGCNLGVPFEPAVNNDCSEVYFINPASAGASDRDWLMKYTINKYKINKDAGTAVAVPLTINLNGLAPYLKAINSALNATCYWNYSNQNGYDTFLGLGYTYSSNARSCVYGGVVLTYLELGTNKYLVATNITNKASINQSFDRTVYSSSISTSGSGVGRACPTSDTNMLTNYAYSFMYLFKINGDTLDLVDARQTLGTSSDTPQAVFPVNNNTAFMCIRYNGIDVLTIDTINDKFVIQDNINDPIYSVGVDDLERVWYTTSNDNFVNDIKLKVFTVGATTLIDTNFETTNFTYVDSDIPSNVLVSAKLNTGGFVVANLQLLLEGNAVFAISGTKTLDITTSADGPVQIPIIIRGDGIINIYTNIFTS